ncbi:hypothetical protein V6N11_073345 [Hibiscus sabdariffa]|uniref:Uncharacterized protein n=2 Tax=Hibiscus sabdariffa TaxID=183260 RepID=A0ABR2CV49_9ROSI
MASRVDALRAIERLDGFMLYGSRVRVSFAARATRDSFWRRKKGSLPRLSDPPQSVVGVVTAATGMAKSRAVSPRRSEKGIVDDVKLAILQTCAIGWVKEATPIRCVVDMVWPVRGVVIDSSTGLVPSLDFAVVGVAGAALAPVLGAISGGICKVKSVNCLVEALASPEQRQVVAVARSRKGRGSPAKSQGLIKVGSDIMNASLTDSDIQVR